jgi:hypothetical protein
MNGAYRGVATAHSDPGRPAIRALRRLGWLPALAGAGVWRALRWLFNLTLGCAHRRKSFPFTPVRKNVAPGAARSRTYVVCLDCGRTFDYDWGEMRMAPSVTARGPAGVRPTRVRV